MRRDDGTLLGLGAAAVLATAAALGGRRRASGSSARRVPTHAGLPVLDANTIERLREEGGLWDYLGELYDGLWYVPDDTEMASVQWESHHGYEPGIYLDSVLEEIPWPITLGMARTSMAYRIDPDTLKAVMFIADVDRLPHISDNLGIQSVLFGLSPTEDDGPGGLFRYVDQHLRKQVGEGYNSDPLWEHIEWLVVVHELAGHSVGEIRELVDNNEPGEVLAQFVDQGFDMDTVRLIGVAQQ